MARHKDATIGGYIFFIKFFKFYVTVICKHMFKTLEAKYHIDAESECLYRYISSNTEYFSMHNHEYFEIFVTVSDGIIHLVNDKKQVLSQGCLVFIRPGDTHLFECNDSTPMFFVNLAFSKKTAEDLFHYLSDGFSSKILMSEEYPPTVMLSPKEQARLLLELDQLNVIKWQDKKQLKLQVRILLMEIFTKHFSNYAQHFETGVPLWLELAYENMQKPRNFSQGSERMVELSGKSREHLARCMRKYYNTSVSAFVNELRINYVANMLQNSNISVLDLCYESGFQNISWFYALFKQKYGITPNKFRAKYG